MTVELTTLLFSSATLVLAALAPASAFIGIERLLNLREVRRQNRLFIQAASPLLVDWKLENMAQLGARYPNSPVAKLFAQMSSRYLAGLQTAQGEDPMALVEREANLGVDEGSAELGRRLPLLALAAALALAFGIVGALAAATFTQALLVALVGAFLASASTYTYRHLKGRTAVNESALQLSADELLYEMACNCDRDTMHEVLSCAA